jgi:membrane associated rhomboid family serine protease
MLCPRCRVRLNRAKTEHGMLFCCPRCGGRAVGLPVLRQVGSKEAVRKLWMLAHDGPRTPGAKCPVCDRPATEVALPVRASSPPLRLDVCAGCQFVWFDPRELEQFPAGAADQERPLSPRAREAIALEEVRRVEEQAERDAYNNSEPDETWHWIPALFGMPVEENAPAVRCWPWLTYGLAAVLVAVYALTCRNLEAVVNEYGLVPDQLWRHGGLTFLTSFLLHGGLFHLIGNVYFLLIFGDNVEDDLGPWRYVGLLAVATIVGDLCHIVGSPHSMVPCIGASGGISGVITYYALRFPHARLGFLFRYWMYFRWVRLPAYVALLFWFVLQFVLAVEERMGIGNVAALAHLGGAAVGVAAWFIWRVRSEQ